MRTLKRLAAVYAALMGAVLAWAGIDYYTHVHRARQAHNR